MREVGWDVVAVSDVADVLVVIIAADVVVVIIAADVVVVIIAAADVVVGDVVSIIAGIRDSRDSDRIRGQDWLQ